jgi:hypothetical protein
MATVLASLKGAWFTFGMTLSGDNSAINYTKLTGGVEQQDPSSLFSLSSNVVTCDVAGKYLILCSGYLDNSAASTSVRVRLQRTNNSAATLVTTAGAVTQAGGRFEACGPPAIYDVTAGTTFEVQGWHNENGVGRVVAGNLIFIKLDYASEPAWVAPTLLNSWVNTGGGAVGAGYYKDSLGRVWVRGRVKSGTSGTVVFTLPAGFRPSASEYYTVLAQGGVLGYMEIQSDGDVIVTAPNTNDCVLQASFRAGT